jgi:crotonobetainyl-CoA:carnitine CoA-transferase CaiB-like acyl-CoA transferase
MPAALEGMRVIDLTHHIVGPYCTKLLADFGADVIKIERPDGGDPTRRLSPFLHDEANDEGSGLFLHLNTNKRSVTLNLKTEAGKALLYGLVQGADVVVASFSPQVVSSLEFDFENLRSGTPNLVVASITNFGLNGPYRDYKMSEITAFALGGTMASSGLPTREPVKLALTVMQIYAGMVASAAVVGAYLGAKRHGVGQLVDLSLFEIMATNQDRALMATAAYQYLGITASHRLAPNRRDITPASAYPCRDGYVQFFALVQSWKAACLLIERPDLIEDPHFTAPENATGNPEVKAEFESIFLEWLLLHDKQEIMERAQRVGYIAGAGNAMEDTFLDRQLSERGFFVEVDHPYAGTLRYPGAPVKMSATPWRAGRAPLLGEHNREVLGTDLGVDDVTLAQLHDDGVI